MIKGVIAGSFDIIHPGYVLMFKEAKTKCDHLTILLHSDPSIERPTKLKPILNIDERILILSSFKFIDEVLPYNTENDLKNILLEKKFNIRFLGDDYKNQPITGNFQDTSIYYFDRSHGWSTTKFKTLIKNSFK